MKRDQLVKDFHSKHTLSFRFALEGIISAFKSQPNLKIIFLATILICLISFYFQISQFEWLLVVLTCFTVMIAEMTNTAIEATVNLATKEWREEAKFAKDVSAGGVLLSVIGSILVGLMIFLPKFVDLIKNLS